VVSALRGLDLDQDLFKAYKHHVVELNDMDDEDIIQYFPETNAFIQEGLDGGGGVLVHW
jgi:dual specificity phosphatase 12